MKKVIKNLYENPSQPGSFSGLKTFAKSISKNKFKFNDIKRVLTSNDSYTLHKQKQKKFPRRQVIVKGIDDTWETDLVDVSSIRKEIQNHKFILTCIDVFFKKKHGL